MSLSRIASALGAFFRRLFSRTDEHRANTAVTHDLARMIYFMLARGGVSVFQGQQWYEKRQRQRSIAAIKHRAADLGFVLAPTTPTS